jgi:malonate-semialdehyde dehydrogenase (acetylating)/methylmalonate-semialdehyde dehydrogenase
VDAARAAFQEWREMPPYTRARIMFHLKELMEQNFEELSRLITEENGKTIDEARGETRRAIENVEGAANIPYLMQGYNLEDVAQSIDEDCVRQPVGVFAVIAPFNFPLMVPMWFLPYAVATGNTYIVKPSEQTPLTQNKLFELFEEVGFPDGVLNLVNGAKDVASQLLENPGVNGISFVGSTPVAKHIYKTGAAHGKRVQAQGGAKNFLVVMPDADIPGTVGAILTSAYGCAGERCLAGSVVLAVGDVYEPLKNALVAVASKITVGYGLDEGTQMGPVISQAARERILGYIESGVQEGAKLLLDGHNCVPPRYPKGYFVGPTIFGHVKPNMKIAREEIFGPVLGIVRVPDFDEALSVIDVNPFGNAASVFTNSGKWARAFRYRVRCGNIGINVGIAAPVAAFPFAGMKDSFFGDLHGQGMDGINFFTDRKVVISRWF